MTERITTHEEMNALIEMYQRDHHGEMPGVQEILLMREAIASVNMSHDAEVNTVEVTADSAYVAHKPEGEDSDDEDD